MAGAERTRRGKPILSKGAGKKPVKAKLSQPPKAAPKKQAPAKPLPKTKAAAASSAKAKASSPPKAVSSAPKAGSVASKAAAAPVKGKHPPKPAPATETAAKAPAPPAKGKSISVAPLASKSPVAVKAPVGKAAATPKPAAAKPAAAKPTPPRVAVKPTAAKPAPPPAGTKGLRQAMLPPASKVIQPKLPREPRTPTMAAKRILPLKKDRGADASKGLPRVSRPPGSTLPTVPPQAARPRPRTLEDRLQSLRELQARATAEQRADLQYRLDVSWIHHDSAIEGTVYEPSELVSTLARMQSAQPGDPPIVFSPLQEEIRQHKLAIDLVRDMATRKKEPITLETLRLLYATLAPDDDEPKGVLKYRKDMPLHRVYFHEIATPDKIPGLMRQLVQWLDSEETRRTMHPTRIASRAHYKLLRIFPFTKHSGKVARLLMNLLLLREGYPPVILHATDRQRYYDAVKVSSDATAKVVNDALENGVESELRYWHRAFGIEETP